MKKRYHSINDVLRTRFGERVCKVSLDGGLSCPNRDGTVGTEGCIFCSMDSYRPLASQQTRDPRQETEGLRPENDWRLATGDWRQSIRKQLQTGIHYIERRHKAEKVISYFQSGSNTHAPASELASMYNDAIDDPAVVGLAISTRPDCIYDEHLDLLEELSRKTMLWIELGLQSSHDETLRFIERGHTVRQFTDACERLRGKNIPVCAHVILGLPNETPEMMLDTARYLNAIRIWGVKIHNLHVLKGTKLEKLIHLRGGPKGLLGGVLRSTTPTPEEWLSPHLGGVNPLSLLTLDEYANMVVDFLEILDPGIIIHRLNSHGPRRLTVAPEWSINKLAIFSRVEGVMEERNTFQGSKLA